MYIGSGREQRDQGRNDKMAGVEKGTIVVSRRDKAGWGKGEGNKRRKGQVDEEE